MTKQFRSIGEVSDYLAERGHLCQSYEFKNIGEMVNSLVNMGHKVEAEDSYMDLEGDLSDDFLSAPVQYNRKYKEEIHQILEVANDIIPKHELYLQDKHENPEEYYLYQ